MATNLGNAYVQIIPSAKGITGSISRLLNPEAKAAGASVGRGLGGKIASVAGKAIAAAGIGKALASSIRAGGALEQSIGGVETLFKDSANIVKNYAKQAYKTSGVSANKYMQQATSFSASLLQSLGGDTKKAAKTADMAIRDMSDNANKMGTNIQSIQDAYQGFAKQNYTMLDNLKLGYGGTKSEMERLLADAEKLTGIKYDINNLDDVFNAIHVIQEELGVTGTTALEAKETLEGSFKAMKASAEDFMGALALGENIKEPLSNLITTTGTFLFGNLLPMVGNIFKALPGAIVQAMSELGPMMVGQGKKLMESLGVGLSDSSPLNGIGQTLMTNLQPVIDSIKTSFSELPELFSTIAEVFLGVVEIIAEGLARLDFSGVADFAGAIIPALTNAFQVFAGIVGPAISMVVDAFVGLWNAIQPVLSILAEALMPVLQILASFLGGVVKGALIAVTTIFDALTFVIQLLTPVFQLLVNVLEFISPVLSKIAEWVGVAIGMFGTFGRAGAKLKDILKNAWDIIKNAVMTAQTAISGAISTLVNIFNRLKSTGTALKSALQTAWRAITNAVSTAAGNISGIVGRIKSTFNSLKNIKLADAGRAIMGSFLSGLKAGFRKVKDFVGGIAGWIREHKGPIEYDRKLLIPAGNAIMEGLNKSMVKSFGDVKDNVLSMAGEIYKGFDITPKDIELFNDNPMLNKEGLRSSLATNLNLDRNSNKDSRLEELLLEILKLMNIMIEKDDDIYLDGEKVSVIIGRKIEEYRQRKEKYNNRRGGVLI